jgi:NO-binding membrane sensor protein with MHYT domain
MKKLLMTTSLCLLITIAGVAQKATVFNTGGTAFMDRNTWMILKLPLKSMHQSMAAIVLTVLQGATKPQQKQVPGRWWVINCILITIKKVQVFWLKNQEELIEKADNQWPEIKTKNKNFNCRLDSFLISG